MVDNVSSLINSAVSVLPNKSDWKIDGLGNLYQANQTRLEESATQNFVLGQLAFYKTDERRFRYAELNTATGAGLICSPDLSAVSVVDTDGIGAAASAGADEVTLTDAGTLSAVTADQFVGGLLVVTGDDGAGHQYKILSNTAASSNAVTFTLTEPLAAAITTDSDFAITPNLFAKNRGATAATDYVVSGVTQIAVTADYFAWLQTWGRGVVQCDGACAGGSVGTLSDGETGTMQLQDAYTEPGIGFFLWDGDDNGFGGVFLTIAA